MNKRIERILPLVQKPGRYTGGELNSVTKDKNKVDLRYAFCFPDTYEIGMSHLGLKILYSLANARDDCWCERVFAPWDDMEEKMREEGIPLFAIESGDEVKSFDMIGFTLQYEMCYTNVLNMLDLAGLPLYSKDRTQLLPLIVAGGPCACNPEPVAPFIDLFMPGEGEEITNELLDLLKKHKKLGSTKEEFLLEAAQLDGIYVPSFYIDEYKADGTLKKLTAINGAPEKVHKRVIHNLNDVFFPDKFIVPYVEAVHDRITHEIFRGCIRGCRFCQAGFIYRPIREKSPDIINEQCKKLIKTSGYDELSLCSLSSSDYTGIAELLSLLLDWTNKQKVNVALPSMRVDNFPEELMQKLKSVRKSGLTFAPEAGTQRLRDVINKNITEEEMLSTAATAFRGGWNSVKLYFMLGLPTETQEDIEAIGALARAVVNEYYKNPDRVSGKYVTVSVSAASFVPKPFTPFQWERQATREELTQKQEILKNSLGSNKVTVSFHHIDESFLEAVFARGDRKLAAVIEQAWRSGCKFDSWNDHLRYDKWLAAFDKCGIDPEFYTSRERDYNELLPWEHLDFGVTKSFLMREREKASRGETTQHCRENCAGCGADKLNGGECHARSKSLH